MSEIALLDNVMWHVLTGPHAPFSAGTTTARRYARGFSPILGFADTQRPDLDALRAFAEPGEHFYCSDWSGPVPAGWTLDAETTMFQMLWSGPAPAEEPAPDAVALGAAHADAALRLAELTRPGPFGPRTLELGEYFGIFDGARLVAMAGERMWAGSLREISGVCTHPEHQGRGLARKLMLKLVQRELQRGQTPFLHVMRSNEGAHALYRRMGFADHRETVVRVISPAS
jgi:ribosomal protein S18 acetylase RimI-like enzyme